MHKDVKRVATLVGKRPTPACMRPKSQSDNGVRSKQTGWYALCWWHIKYLYLFSFITPHTSYRSMSAVAVQLIEICELSARV